MRREKKSRRAPGRAARPKGVTGERGTAAGGRRHDVAASGGGGATWLGGENASGVGRAAGGRAGSQVVRVGRQGAAGGQGDCRRGGGGRRSSETEREGREEDDEDLSVIFQQCKGFTVK
jgi:hypothetical protein